MSEMQVFEGNFEQRPFNTPLEYGFRALFILDAADNVAMDLQRIVSYDYLLVHTSDVPMKWSTKTGHRVRVFSSIDFPIRLVVTHHYIRAVLVRCNIQRYSPLLRELHR